MSAEGVATSDEIVTVRIIIGRTNPPHSGHIKLMKAAIDAARLDRGPIKCALLLLGNGPGGQRTNEDPIDHDTKSSFIRTKLTQEHYQDNVDFVIHQMKAHSEGGASQNILDFLQSSGIVPDSYLGSIRIIQFTGKKPGKPSKTGQMGLSDSEKHQGLRLIIQKRIRSIYSNSPSVTCEQEDVDAQPISGETPMSATEVRKTAVSCYDKGMKGDGDDGGHGGHGGHGDGAAAVHSDVVKLANGFDCWKRTFDFYDGDDETTRLSKIMYDSIIEHKDDKHNPSKRPGMSFVGSKSAKKDPQVGRGKGGSRRKQTRKRILRNKKTLRRNRNNRKHRHTRR